VGSPATRGRRRPGSCRAPRPRGAARRPASSTTRTLRPPPAQPPNARSAASNARSASSAPATTSTEPPARIAVRWCARTSSIVAVRTTPSSPIERVRNGWPAGYVSSRQVLSATLRVSFFASSSSARACARTNSRASGASAGVTTVSPTRSRYAPRSSARHCPENTAACAPTSSRADAPRASSASDQARASRRAVPRSIACAVSRATPGRPAGSKNWPASIASSAETERRPAIGTAATRSPFVSVRRSMSIIRPPG
jgi:hypothetical protein